MNIFNYIKSKVSILDIIKEHTSLKHVGTYWKASCPICLEKETKSLTVNPNKEFFYCFNCKVGGDVIAFVARLKNCSQLEAVKIIANQSNISLNEINI